MIGGCIGSGKTSELLQRAGADPKLQGYETVLIWGVQGVRLAPVLEVGHQMKMGLVSLPEELLEKYILLPESGGFCWYDKEGKVHHFDSETGVIWSE